MVSSLLEAFLTSLFLLNIYSAPLWGFVVAFMLFNVKGKLVKSFHGFPLTFFREMMRSTLGHFPGKPTSLSLGSWPC